MSRLDLEKLGGSVGRGALGGRRKLGHFRAGMWEVTSRSGRFPMRRVAQGHHMNIPHMASEFGSRWLSSQRLQFFFHLSDFCAPSGGPPPMGPAPDAPALPPKGLEASRGRIESPCTLNHPGEPGDQPAGGPQSPRCAWIYPSPAPSGARSRCSSAPSQGSRGF